MDGFCRKFHSAMSRLYRHDEGATVIEYAVLSASIAAVIVAIVMALGLSVKNLFDTTRVLLEAYL